MKKFLFLLLSICLTVGTFPASIFAGERTNQSIEPIVVVEENIPYIVETTIEGRLITVNIIEPDGQVVNTITNVNGILFLDGEVVSYSEDGTIDTFVAIVQAS